MKLTKSIGLKPKPEIGILFGAGGDTEGLESKGTRDPRWVIEVSRVLRDLQEQICSSNMGDQSIARGEVSECWGVYDNGVDIDPTSSLEDVKT